MFYTATFQNTIGSFNLYKLDSQCKYRVSSIEHNSGIVMYRINSGIDPVLLAYSGGLSGGMTRLIVSEISLYFMIRSAEVVEVSDGDALTCSKDQAKQSINRLTNRSTNGQAKQSINRLTNRSTNGYINRSVDRWTNRLIVKTYNQLIDRSINQTDLFIEHISVALVSLKMVYHGGCLRNRWWTGGRWCRRGFTRSVYNVGYQRINNMCVINNADNWLQIVSL